MEMERIDHFSHRHPLEPCEPSGEDNVRCSACEKPCMGQSYGCRDCRFCLHKECAELKREITHSLHPAHNLKLSDTAYMGQFYCDACDKMSRGFTYHCDECDFDLDIDCARGKAESEDKRSINHFSHKHELILEEGDVGQEVWCRACEKRCSSPAYVCKDCGYFLHKSCVEELPQEIHHFLDENHPMKLQAPAYDEQIWCYYCDKKVLGFTYHCEQCHYYLDVECAQLRVPFGHRHPLLLSEKEEEDNVLCRACQERCTGDTFGCERCEFFLHRSCAELPKEMNNPFHEGHPLKLQIVFSNICDNCELWIDSYAYRCDQCDFDLDIKCAKKLADNPELGNVHERMKKDVVDEEMQHFAHKQHKLKRSEEKDGTRYRCMACEKRCRGVVYGCDTCEFFLHESCAELPERIDHYFHEHELTLQSNELEARNQQEKKEQKKTCRACEKKCGGFTYSCPKSMCRFDMDVECTLLMDKRKSQENYIEHFCHGHPLKLLTEKDKPGVCSACRKNSSGDMYGCDSCRVWLHKSCADNLQREIYHFFHRHKDQELKLNTQIRNVKCKACRKECQGFTFNCEKCDFNLDFACALMPLREKDGHEFLGHGHPLKLIEIDVEKDSHCSVCEEHCCGSRYECGTCNFCVHKVCGELEENITHEFHPAHHLELKIKDRFKCAACLKESSGFTYDCALCHQFSLHVGCKDLKPVIKYDDHLHPLAFFKSVYGKEKLQCNNVNCKIPSSIEKERNVVRCVECIECKYNLHLLCGPLPCTINTKKHKHPLTLKDKFIVEGSDESYCDACEKERDPDQCVYKCDVCPYVAAFDCMEPEVIELLQGKENHVKLRSLHGGVPGEVITEGIKTTEMVEKRPLGDDPANSVKTKVAIENEVSLDNLLDSFVMDEDMNLMGSVEFLKKEMADLQDRISRIVPNVSSYPYTALKELIARLESSIKKAEFSMIFFKKEEIEKVEEFMTVRSLAPTLKQLLHSHKDIVDRSKQNSKSRSFVFTMLCGAVRSMLKFDGQIHTVSETLLLNWWNHFILANGAGFNVEFLMDRLRKITLAYLAHKAKEVQEQKLGVLADKIKESEKFFRDQKENLEDISKEEELIR